MTPGYLEIGVQVALCDLVIERQLKLSPVDCMSLANSMLDILLSIVFVKVEDSLGKTVSFSNGRNCKVVTVPR